MAAGPIRVAVCNLEIAGALNPVLPILAELVQRGCDVRYYLSKDTLVQDVEGVGATVARFDDYLGRWEDVLVEEAEWLRANGIDDSAARAPVLEMSMPLRMMFYAIPAGVCLAKRLLDSWREEDWRPDVVMYKADISFAFIAAQALGVPSVSFTTHPGPGTPLQIAEVPEAERPGWDAFIESHPLNVAAERIAQQLFHADVKRIQFPCRHYSLDVNLVFSTAVLDRELPLYERERVNKAKFLWVGNTGDCTYRTKNPIGGAVAGAPWVVDEGVKVVVVSLGSMTVGLRWDKAEHVSSLGRFTGGSFSTRLWTELKEHFGNRSDVRVVLGIGPRPEAVDALGDLPSNFAALPYFDQVDALAYADVFVTHGGFNSIKEGVLAGVPMVVVPFNVDQPSSAVAVQRCGAGVGFPDLMATPRGQVAAAVEDALWGPSAARQRDASRAVGLALRTGGGVLAASDAVLELAAPAAVLGQAARGGA